MSKLLIFFLTHLLVEWAFKCFLIWECTLVYDFWAEIWQQLKTKQNNMEMFISLTQQILPQISFKEIIKDVHKLFLRMFDLIPLYLQKLKDKLYILYN